jgi:hypothetical protein
LTEKGQKAARQIKSTMDKKKELLTLTPGDDADGRNEGNDDDDGQEPVKAITSPCYSVSRYWALSAKKSF